MLGQAPYATRTAMPSGFAAGMEVSVDLTVTLETLIRPGVYSLRLNRSWAIVSPYDGGGNLVSWFRSSSSTSR